MQSYSPPTFIMMAPMEGVIDHTMREIFSAIGGIDRCVTEFVRVSQLRLPERVFKRYCPELLTECKTRTGTPVYLQILGDNPEAMAANAAKAAMLGGCPARSVNNHGGGAVLLQNPDNLFTITKAIRSSVPAHIPVTAKMRLGFNDKSRALENAFALQEAGATEIAIHGRTKKEGYRPPAYWDEIGKIRAVVSIPVIANGEIWNTDDLKRCQQESQCQRIMLGRGLVACPDLALYAKGQTDKTLHWGDICLLLVYYFLKLQEDNCEPQYINSLIKQWIIYLRYQYADAHLFFEKAKILKQPNEMLQALTTEFHQQQSRKSISGHIGQLDLTGLLQQLNDNLPIDVK
jgi:tRNA-dihydrouridine synthase C